MPVNVNGQLSLLRVHDRGTAYGPPNDRIDVEVVVQFVHRPNDAYGFQLRDDANGPARRGMLDVLRDGFNHGWRVWIDYDAPPGRRNGVLLRAWVTKPPRGTGGRPVVGVGASEVVEPTEPVMDPSQEENP